MTASVRHFYRFLPNPMDVMLTSCTLIYGGNKVYDKEFLQRVYRKIYESATILWCEDDNHGLDPEWNLMLFMGLMLSCSEDDVCDFLQQFTQMEINNEKTGHHLNENHVIISFI